MSTIYPLYERVAAALKAGRTARGYSQDYVAERLGRKRSAISMIENAKAQTSLSLLVAYGELVGVEVLLVVDDRTASVDRLAAQLLRSRSITTERAEQLLALVRVWEAQDQARTATA